MEIGGSNPPGVADSNFFLTLGLYPVLVSLPFETKHKLPTSILQEIAVAHRNSISLRQLAKQYGVSYETIRRALTGMQSQTTVAQV